MAARDNLNHVREPGTKTSWLDSFLQRRGIGIVRLHEILFSLNIAFAPVYALLLYVSRNQALWTPANDSTYYVSRSAYRLNDLLRIGSNLAVETGTVARHSLSPWDQVGYELLVAVTILSLAAIILLLPRFLAPSAAHRVLLGSGAGATALFAVPLFYFCVSRLTWSWPASYDLGPSPPSDFWRNPWLAVFAGEILCFGTIFAISKTRRLPTWTASSLLLSHYAFWTVVLWPNFRIELYRLFVLGVLFMAFPAAGIVWLLYVKGEQASHSATSDREKAREPKSVIATAAVAVSALVLVWMPPRGLRLAQFKDLQSLKIEMTRGACRGSCPAYAIAIHGNGAVDYVGSRFVDLKGPAATTISHEQLVEILQALDRVRFSTLEDRAFFWCFDTPSVAVSVSLDGQTMRVVSDAGCTGARSGMQSQFVKSANEIDEIVGSSRWVSCNGGPCWR